MPPIEETRTLTVADLAKDLSWAQIPRIRILLHSSGRLFDMIEPAGVDFFCLLQEGRGRLRRHFVESSAPVSLVGPMRESVEWRS